MNKNPILAVSMIVFRGLEANEILLVERGKPPAKGLWAPPGGKVEWGETIVEAARREVWEETGVHLQFPPSPVFTTLDRIHRTADGTITHHFLLVEVVGWCEKESVLIAGDDAAACRWWEIAKLHDAQPQVDQLPRLVTWARSHLNNK